MPLRVRAVEHVRFPVAVIADTREQLPFTFTGLRGPAARGRPLIAVDVVRGTLKSGDYSLAGHQVRVAVERKSVADLFHTLGQGRERFARELARLDAMTVACVVVEGEWSEVLAYPAANPGRCRLTPKSVFRSVLAWQQRFRGVHWLFCPGRTFAEAATFRVLERYLADSTAAAATTATTGAAR